MHCLYFTHTCTCTCSRALGVKSRGHEPVTVGGGGGDETYEQAIDLIPAQERSSQPELCHELSAPTRRTQSSLVSHNWAEYVRNRCEASLALLAASLAAVPSAHMYLSST